MIILTENFNHLSLYTLQQKYQNLLNSSYATNIISDKDPFYTIDGINLSLGIKGDKFLGFWGNSPSITFKNLQKSRLLILGICIGSLVQRGGTYQTNNNSYDYAYIENEDRVYYPLIYNIYSTGYIEWNFYFKNETTNLFKITIHFEPNNPHVCDIYFDNLDDSLAEISPQTDVPIDLCQKVFLEVYCDSEGAEGSAGTVKVAINGKAVAIRENIVSSNINVWGGDPSNEASYFQQIKMEVYTYHSSDVMLIDSVYICNEEGGVHDDFLGLNQITTLYPSTKNIGDQNNWIGYKNGIIVENHLNSPNASLVSETVMDAEQSAINHIEADSENLRELYYFDNNQILTADNVEILGINFRTAVKKLFDDTTEVGFDKALVAITKPSGNDISKEISSRILVDEYIYKFLDLYYGVVPDLAVDWSWELFEGTQFGFESAQVKHQLFLNDFLSIADIAEHE